MVNLKTLTAEYRPWDVSSCVHGDQKMDSKSRNDVFLTLSRWFLCLILTRAGGQHCDETFN